MCVYIYIFIYMCMYIYIYYCFILYNTILYYFIYIYIYVYIYIYIYILLIHLFIYYLYREGGSYIPVLPYIYTFFTDFQGLNMKGVLLDFICRCARPRTERSDNLTRRLSWWPGLASLREGRPQPRQPSVWFMAIKVSFVFYGIWFNVVHMSVYW